MQTDPSSYFRKLNPKSGVVVVDGHGARIRIERGHLVITDGIGPAARERRFPRAGHGLKRLIVLGQTGYVSLEAIRWMSDVGIAFIHVDRSGRVLATSAILGLDQPLLRRAQALAGRSSIGLDIARQLIALKVDGQTALLDRLPDAERTRVEIATHRKAVDSAQSLDGLRRAEALAAAVYWRAWEPICVPFARTDLRKVPDHWRRFGRRGSAVTGGPRSPSNPPNAILGYEYALLESETRIACLAVGLDPGLGFLHADQKARDSLALDVMEAARPSVDAYVLNLLETSIFRAKDFFETRQGVCRILPPLTHHLATTTTLWAKAVAPIVERVAATLAERSGTKIGRLPTLLTGANRSSGRDAYRRRPKRQDAPRPPRRRDTCKRCESLVTGRGRAYCDACYQLVADEITTQLSSRGAIALSTLRSEGRDPAHGGSAAKKRGAKIAAANTARARWVCDGTDDPSVFTREILPRLSGASATELAHATGMSYTYCRLILKGHRIPHPSRWEAFRSARKLTSKGGGKRFGITNV